MQDPLQKRAPMYMTLDSRLLGLAVTVFILILTIKSDLLAETIITSQLVLSIPFFIGSMLSNAKITDSTALEKYYFFNRFTTALAFAFLFNTLGLIVSKYVSHLMGIMFFAALLILLLIIATMDYTHKKLTIEALTIVMLILFGLLPALGIY